ncbi:MAG: hypothetical protein ABJF10_09775 [Chthoniobacter sp.]|uniref:hypothetical protein n=1 Tax=Chthoniobacter sp. TaxID=2510640 RepID=UPI0032A94C8C
MTPEQTAELTELKSQLVHVMEGYMEEVEECGYTNEDIDACTAVIAAYVATVSRPADPESILATVQKTVMKLNAINEKCHGGLIETDQQEMICEIINQAAEYAGVKVGSDDLTEEWREW